MTAQPARVSTAGAVRGIGASGVLTIIMTAPQFDDTGERALEQASRIAQRDPAAELHVIHVIAPSLAPERNGESTSSAVQLARTPDRLREYVDELAREARSRSCARAEWSSAR